MMEHRDKRGLFLPSRGLDHKTGLGREKPRGSCPSAVGRKVSVTRKRGPTQYNQNHV